MIPWGQSDRNFDESLIHGRKHLHLGCLRPNGITESRHRTGIAARKVWMVTYWYAPHPSTLLYFCLAASEQKQRLQLR